MWLSLYGKEKTEGFVGEITWRFPAGVKLLTVVPNICR